jgi:hypothetical protein
MKKKKKFKKRLETSASQYQFLLVLAHPR